MVTEWQGRLQFRVDRIGSWGRKMALIGVLYKPPDGRGHAVRFFTIKITGYKGDVSCALNEEGKLMHYPAAKNHHAIRSTSCHILTMLSWLKGYARYTPIWTVSHEGHTPRSEKTMKWT